jgi:hypothetical protein
MESASFTFAETEANVIVRAPFYLTIRAEARPAFLSECGHSQASRFPGWSMETPLRIHMQRFPWMKSKLLRSMRSACAKGHLSSQSARIFPHLFSLLEIVGRKPFQVACSLSESICLPFPEHCVANKGLESMLFNLSFAK